MSFCEPLLLLNEPAGCRRFGIPREDRQHVLDRLLPLFVGHLRQFTALDLGQ